MTDTEFLDDEYRGRLDVGLWRRVLAHAKPYRREVLGLALSGLIMAGADALLPLVTGWVVDDAVQGARGRALLAGHALLFLGIVLLMCLLVWLFILLAGRIGTGMAYDMRRAGFAHLQELSFSFYDRRPVGWLMARLTSDCERLASLIPWSLLDVCWGAAFLLGICGMMLWMDAKLAGLVMLVLPPLAVVSLVFQGKLLRSQRLVRKANSQITASFHEGIQGVRTTKALVREEESLREFQGLAAAMRDHSVQNALQAAVYLPVVLSLGSAGVGIALWRGGLELGGGMTYGGMVAFLQLATLLYIPVQEMAARFTQLQAAQASAERLQQLLDEVPDVRDDPAILAGGLPAPSHDGGAERIESVEFDGVSFAYKEGEPVLDRFDLRVGAGETVALVGPTGGGKTTIASLAARFYEPSSGAIRVNGTDYRRLPLRWLQSRLGIVLQTPHLFSGSVRENIRYGRLEASDPDVEEAARRVRAHDFIAALEKGYDTDAGEFGNRLSTGQKQLVSLARAVLADPQVLILDEATSSVDTETEALIQRGVERLLRGRISFVIAHRLSTIRSAGRILVIEGGRIAEQGSHAELMARRGPYYRMYTGQFARESQEQALEAGAGTPRLAGPAATT